MSEYREFAEDLARQAGKIIKEFFTLGMTKQWKEDTTPVTEADKKINDLVIKAVKRRFPTHGVIAEEESDYNGQEYVWICDPVDGTIPFSHGIPLSTFMLALTRKGESILGVIYDPFQDRLFVGEKGKGAFLNHKPIKVNTNSSLVGTVIGMNYWKKERMLENTHHALLESLTTVMISASVGYLDALVAAGELSANIFGGSSPWDSAAAAIIVKEAGGKYTDIYGKEIIFKGKVAGHVASNGVVHDKLLAMIRKDL